MAVVLWSNLPTDIILLIAKVLSSDVDTVRLRSVCSRWRSSIRRRYRPSVFPLELPPLFANLGFPLDKGIRYFLHYSTICHFSPPEFGSYTGDPSDGYLLRVVEVSPNTFTPLPLLSSEYPNFDPPLVPEHVNLLDFRVSELCKCYSVECVNSGRNVKTGKAHFIMKVVVLWNYDVDCEFAVMVLIKTGLLNFWKFGDDKWSAINIRGHKLEDLVLYDGKCYAISSRGVLFFIDSKFNLIVAPSLPRLPVDCNEYVKFYLMEYKSELYVMSTYYDEDNPEPYMSSDEEIPFEVKIFKKGNGTWEHIKCLGDEVFLFCNDVSVGLSVKDFSGCKGNLVYLSPETLYPYGLDSDGEVIEYGVHDLDEGRTLLKNWEVGYALIYRSPPKWLLSSCEAVQIDPL